MGKGVHLRILLIVTSTQAAPTTCNPFLTSSLGALLGGLDIGGQRRREETPGNLGLALPSPAPSVGQPWAVRMCGARAVLAGL